MCSVHRCCCFINSNDTQSTACGSQRKNPNTLCTVLSLPIYVCINTLKVGNITSTSRPVSTCKILWQDFRVLNGCRRHRHSFGLLRAPTHACIPTKIDSCTKQHYLQPGHQGMDRTFTYKSSLEQKLWPTIPDEGGYSKHRQSCIVHPILLPLDTTQTSFREHAHA